MYLPREDVDWPEVAGVEHLHPEVGPLQQRSHRHAAEGERRRHRRRRLLGVPRQVVQVRQGPRVAGVEADHPASHMEVQSLM